MVGSVWTCGGLLVAGVGAALFAGAGVSAADTGATHSIVSSGHPDSSAGHPGSRASGPLRRSDTATLTAPAPAGTPIPSLTTNSGRQRQHGAQAAATVPSRPERPVAVALSNGSAPSMAGARPQQSTPSVTAVPLAASGSTPASSASVPAAAVASTPAPAVDVNSYLGKWFEQGSVKLPFEWFLVNTTATYTLNTDGSIRVANSGNLFSSSGPKINIVGSAVPVNSTNTRLAVNFFVRLFRGEPGNYWVLDHAPDYSWSIVSDPTGFSGYILTRDATLPAGQYQQLVKEARTLGVWGPITPTKQNTTA